MKTQGYAIVAALCLATGLADQQVDSPSAVIRGRVFKSTEGQQSVAVAQHLGGALVTLFGSGTHRYRTWADADGSYEFHGVAAGRYVVEASHSGYVPRQFGATRVGGLGTVVIVA